MFKNKVLARLTITALLLIMVGAGMSISAFIFSINPTLTAYISGMASGAFIALLLAKLLDTIFPEIFELWQDDKDNFNE